MTLLDLAGWEADPVINERAALAGQFAVGRGDFARADEVLPPAFDADPRHGKRK